MSSGQTLLVLPSALPPRKTPVLSGWAPDRQVRCLVSAPPLPTFRTSIARLPLPSWPPRLWWHMPASSPPAKPSALDGIFPTSPGLLSPRPRPSAGLGACPWCLQRNMFSLPQNLLNSSAVSPLHTNLQVANFQRGKRVSTSNRVRSSKWVLVSSIHCPVRACSTGGCGFVDVRVQYCIQSCIIKPMMSGSKRGEDWFEPSKEPESVPSASGVSETAACPPSPVADDPSALLSPTWVALLSCSLTLASVCHLLYCTFQGTIL